jgi:hypothetical protein
MRDPEGFPSRPVNPRTAFRRGDHCLTPNEVKQAIQMRDAWKWSFTRIADALHKPVADVRVALNRTRSPDPNNKRAMLNGWVKQRDQLRAMALPDEPMHATLGRVLAFLDAMDQLGYRPAGGA